MDPCLPNPVSCHVFWLDSSGWPPGLLKTFALGPKPTAVCVHVLSHFSHIGLFDPMDCSLPGSFVHRILQARILERSPMPSSGPPGGEQLKFCSMSASIYTNSSRKVCWRLNLFKQLVSSANISLKTYLRAYCVSGNALGSKTMQTKGAPPQWNWFVFAFWGKSITVPVSIETLT